MNVHITNIYGFIQEQDLRKKQNLYADAGHALGFKEMGIFNFDVSTDTENELSKRIDGIISSLKFNDLVFIKTLFILKFHKWCKHSTVLHIMTVNNEIF